MVSGGGGEIVVRGFGIIMKNTKAAQLRRVGFSPVFEPFWVRVGVGAMGFRVGLGVALGLRPYLNPTRKCFLARQQRTARRPL